MPRTIYALLVGIDQYVAPLRPLQGCVNDIVAFETFLRERVGGNGTALNIKTIKDADATRQAVIDGFRQHLGQAGSEDVAIFYYSGHGSQDKAPPEFWRFEPDKMNETLVCYDSRMNGRNDLADKELAKLIAEVGARNPQIVVILDCCNSGTGTRAIEAAATRRAPTDERPRPLDSFIVSPDEVNALSATRSAAETSSDWVTLPSGKHILFAACRSDELSKEYKGGGRQRGGFSYFLTDTLQQSGGSLTYRELYKRASALVRSNIAQQNPQIEASNLDDLDLPFLGGAIADRSPYYTLSYDSADGWVIDGGAVHGIPEAVNPDDPTTLALFPFNSTPEQTRDLAAALGEARVIDTLANKSKVAVTLRDGSQPDQGQTYKAIVTSLPVPVLGVLLEGDDAGVQQIRAAIANASPDGKASLYVREADANAPATLRVLANAATYSITRPNDDRDLTTEIAGYTEESARKVVQRLEHIARWTTILNLKNPATRILPGTVRMEFQRVVGPPVTRDPADAQTEPLPDAGELRLEYGKQNEKWKAPQFKIKLINTGSQRLFCMLLDLTERYAIDPALIPGGGVWLDAGAEAWANNGTPLTASVPDELWQDGVTEYRDVIKLLVSTEESDATLLAQDKLDLPRQNRATRGGTQNTLNRLMRRVQTREISTQSETGGDYTDWTTGEVGITTVRPLDAVPLPNTGNFVQLGAGVQIAPHPALQASARLNTVTQVGRDLGNLVLPPILRDDPEATQPLQFTRSRASDPGLSVLELNNVADHTVVTPEQPLRLRVDQPLMVDEHVLPVGYDGEFFLPLGSARSVDGATEITLDRLPAPLIGGTRDLKGSIRIFFQKVLTQRFGKQLGLEFPYPILAAAYTADDGKVTYYGSAAEVKQRVEAAQRIVLYIHGIIGDTRGMATSSRALGFKQPPIPPALADRYDLVLTFDYENINTTIEATALALKQRLEAVGLGAGHGKTLHVIAHSMGGLVARWLIEREGGAKIVQHLVLLGTPSAGSPWPTVQAWAGAALGIGLNSLNVVAWPVTALGWLLGSIETIDVTLDQMAPNSQFLQTLNAGADPGIPYTILAGNTSIIPEAATQTDGNGSRLARLFQRLTGPRLLHSATALAFFGQPNDIAVSVQSIGSVPMNRAPQPVLHEIPCDHITYFSTVAGLTALAQALDQAIQQPA